MPVVITSNNTPTAGGVTYGDGTTYATTSAGTSGQLLQSNGASTPSWVAAPTTEAAADMAERIKKHYQYDRAKEYPPISDYIDGVVKGDQAQVQAYIDACLAVKAKYPKPTQE